jgi:hypothetical protein
MNSTEGPYYTRPWLRANDEDNMLRLRDTQAFQFLKAIALTSVGIAALIVGATHLF